MASPSRPPNTDDDTDLEHGPGSATGTPRWVKVFAIIAIVLALMLIISLLTGGNHGPGRHIPSAGVTVHVGHQR